MKVIVTGAKGFVGKEIAAELLKKNNIVFEVGKRKTSELSEVERENIRNYFDTDITDLKKFTDLDNLENIDAIVHSAGLAHQFGDIEEKKFYQVNVLGTKNVAELAVKLKVKQFILISSTAVYGRQKDGINEDAPCQPETLYAKSKLEAERICIEICRKSQLPLTILRLAPVLGENNAGNAARLISAIDNRRFLWIGKGENLKSLIDKTDVAQAVVKILENKKDKLEIYNLAAKPIKMKEFVGAIENNLKKNAPKIYIPQAILRVIFLINKNSLNIKKIGKLSETVEKWLSDDVYLADKIKKEYGFEPTTQMTESLKKQVKYYLDGKNKG